MTYDEAMRFWMGRINYEQRPAQPGDLKLDRMRSLLRLLGQPQERYRIVHVAGSKGKGSTSAMFARVLQLAGYRTGLFTSPHLVRVEERFQVNGEPITAEELSYRLEEIREACRRSSENLEATLTFFEICTAVGFLHFTYRRVEAAVVEVGLGGRFDSTNVCRPSLAVITSISLDHTQQLGDTLAQIAQEKAGIIKEGRPTLSGVLDPEAQAVIEQTARARASPFLQLGRDFQYQYESAQVQTGMYRPGRVRVATPNKIWPWMELGLIGEHQAGNAALVITGVEALRQQGFIISDRAVEEGLKTVSWPARMETWNGPPRVVLDCAHNVASAQTLVETLRASFPVEGRRLLIFACSRDKDVAGMVQVLAPHFARLYLTKFHSSSRCLPPEQVLEHITPERRKDCVVSEFSADALTQAWKDAGPKDLICGTGSVFLAGELRPLLAEKKAPGTVP